MQMDQQLQAKTDQYESLLLQHKQLEEKVKEMERKGREEEKRGGIREGGWLRGRGGGEVKIEKKERERGKMFFFVEETSSFLSCKETKNKRKILFQSTIYFSQPPPHPQ